ncbi:MAG: prolipoprotein diacylglyceryl transferase [Gammaproteobacteria bacterium]|nr:prolipoprotein diacylglyceryl transferase [Gammaproteobacteria bacterium]
MLPEIDPVALDLGVVQIHWYGLMYLAAFAAGWWLAWLRAPAAGWRREEIADFVFYAALGVIIGGRLGYVFFYKPGEFIANPLYLFAIQQGGMSFHGGLLGVMAAMAWYARKTKRTFFMTTDFIAPLVPPGLFAGRVGNFVNGELWGAPTDLPWGVRFARADALPRHPSQLYEAALEGLALFVLLWFFAKKPRPVMAVSALFLAGYGAARFAVEFVRQPDAHLGYLAFGWVTMGHVLTAPMIAAGVIMLVIAYKRGIYATELAPRTPEPAQARPVATKRNKTKSKDRKNRNNRHRG